MIPQYLFKTFEELARAVVMAVGTYVVMAIASGGLPTTQQAVIALISGAVPIAWAAIRTALDKTPVTNNIPPAVTPQALPPIPTSTTPPPPA